MPPFLYKKLRCNLLGSLCRTSPRSRRRGIGRPDTAGSDGRTPRHLPIEDIAKYTGLVLGRNEHLLPMTVKKRLHLDDVYVLVPEVFQDDRGFFSEVFRADKFKELGLPYEFVQDNHSGSVRGVLRGLHFQWNPPMGKLMRVTRGAAFLVAVDIRKHSPTLGQWVGMEASAENRRQVFAGRVWHPLGRSPWIRWALADVTLSEKDRKVQSLQEWLSRPEADNFTY